MRSDIDLSVIVPVGPRHDELHQLYGEYSRGTAATGLRTEFIFVLDGPMPEVATQLRLLADGNAGVVVVSLTRESGEATALMLGFEQARGALLLTLPAYHQIEPEGIPKLVEGLRNSDMAVAHRFPRKGGSLEAMRRNLFHGWLGKVTGLKLHDLGCGARAMKRRVFEEITLYGDQHRFLPILAHRQGFRVVEVEVAQSRQDKNRSGYRVRDYAHRFLDLFTVFFLVRFTKKPLRFFGMVGVVTFLLGTALVTYMVIERIFFDVGLSDRPALLLASLLVVLGLQVFAIGLLGELIIFTHAKDVKDYQVDEVIQIPARRIEGTPGNE
jgi:glycosyl transferase family 2